MASFNTLAFAALLLLLSPIAAKGDDALPPALSPIFDRICQEVECGKGTCKAGIEYALDYICECDSGWKRTNDDDNSDDTIKFLPCIIPNCTLNYSCQPAPPPIPEKEVPFNISYFDPCYWIYCGEGKCNRTSTYRHECDCNPGFSNLLNKTYFPCYSQCTIGSDCSKVGIVVSDEQASPAGSPAGGKATTFLPGKLHWLAVLAISMAMLLWK